MLIHFFHTIITYPVLNILIWLYFQVHNLALAIIILSCFKSICLSWPSRFLRAYRQARRKKAFQTVAEHIQRRYANDPQAMQEALSLAYREFYRASSIFDRFPILSFLSLYLTCGMYIALAVLGGSSLQALNAVLYPFVPHLSALPDDKFSFLGETISLGRPGMMLWFLLIIALITLLNAYLAVRRGGEQRWSQSGLSFTVTTPPETTGQQRIGCALLMAALAYPFTAGIAIIFAWLFAAGTLLEGVTSSLLRIPEDAATIYFFQGFDFNG